ncbi:MAG: PaaI family thioesterase [Myxococcales bacterium]|nr:PaaI family thioesterase [Myxococcales bacterium]
MIGGVPFNTALGMRVEGVAEGTATVLLPYRTELVGNPDTGGLHGGVITSLIDAGCGLAVVLKLMRATRIATLDLRIDYLRPATPPRDVRARCECHKVTRQIAFVRAVAYHDDPGDAIASAAGTFMIFDEGRSPMGETVSKP